MPALTPDKCRGEGVMWPQQSLAHWFYVTEWRMLIQGNQTPGSIHRHNLTCPMTLYLDLITSKVLSATLMTKNTSRHISFWNCYFMLTLQKTLYFLCTVYVQHCVSKKYVPTFASCRFDKHWLILIIFGKHQLTLFFYPFTFSLSAVKQPLWKWRKTRC